MNKKAREIILGIFALGIIAAAVLSLYTCEKQKGGRELAKRISALNSKGGGIPETIEGLRTAINLYEEQIERNVREGAQAGVYWKILAIRLADRGMHRDALDAIEQAVHYNSNDPTLYYLTGDYASIAAASTLEFSAASAAEKEQLIKLAESAYLRSIQLDPVYARPRIGLGILYTFDLLRPAEAIPHLERYLDLTSNNIEGMFVLARAYFMVENFKASVDMYDRIISRTKDAKIKENAMNNKAEIQKMTNFSWGLLND